MKHNDLKALCGYNLAIRMKNGGIYSGQLSQVGRCFLLSPSMGYLNTRSYGFKASEARDWAWLSIWDDSFEWAVEETKRRQEAAIKKSK